MLPGGVGQDTVDGPAPVTRLQCLTAVVLLCPPGSQNQVAQQFFAQRWQRLAKLPRDSASRLVEFIYGLLGQLCPGNAVLCCAVSPDIQFRAGRSLGSTEQGGGAFYRCWPEYGEIGIGIGYQYAIKRQRLVAKQGFQCLL